MTTPLVLDAIEQAIWTREREGVTDLTGLIHHNDRGSQGEFNWSSQHLVSVEVCGGSWWGAVVGWVAEAVGGGSGVASVDAFARAA